MLGLFNGFPNPFYDVDDAAGGGDCGYEESGEEEEEVAEPLDEEGEEEEEVAEPLDRKNDSDSAFADMRRRNEAYERRIIELEQEVAEREEALGLYFEGDNKVAQAHAHYEDVPLEEVVRNMEQRRNIENIQNENASLKEENELMRYNQLKSKDLAEIKEKFPDAKLKDVEELGDKFFQWRTMGIPASEIYERMQMEKGTPPKPIGKVKTSKAEKTFYTRDDVEKMSSQERINNYDIIRKSMSKW